MNDLTTKLIHRQAGTQNRTPQPVAVLTTNMRDVHSPLRGNRIRKLDKNVVRLESYRKRRFHVVTWKRGDVLDRKQLVEAAAVMNSRGVEQALPDGMVLVRDACEGCFSILHGGVVVGSLVEMKT